MLLAFPGAASAKVWTSQTTIQVWPSVFKECPEGKLVWLTGEVMLTLSLCLSHMDTLTYGPVNWTGLQNHSLSTANTSVIHWRLGWLSALLLPVSAEYRASRCECNSAIQFAIKICRFLVCSCVKTGSKLTTKTLTLKHYKLVLKFWEFLTFGQPLCCLNVYYYSLLLS